MKRATTHTVPNTVTVRTVLTAGHRPVQCAIVWRDREPLAYYPATWPGNFLLPSVAEAQRDARWQVAP